MILLTAISGCAMFKSAVADEFGTDGWRKSDEIPGRAIEAVRGADRVWIGTLPDYPGHFLIKIHPISLKFAPPSWATYNKALSHESGFYDLRFYSLEGRSAEDVYQYYIDWFDFQPLYPDEDGGQ
jgi:hypothetical protein